MSIASAVCPVTSTRTTKGAATAVAFSRRVATRSLVATELRPRVGMTSTTVTFLLAFCSGGETEANRARP